MIDCELPQSNNNPRITYLFVMKTGNLLIFCYSIKALHFYAGWYVIVILMVTAKNVCPLYS